jgi:predicted esterase
MIRLLVLMGFIFSMVGRAQDSGIPSEILNELETILIETKEDTFMCRVVYPANYNPEKEYKCFLGLAGGKQSLADVNYSYAAWFRSGYFKDYLTILPVAQSDSNNFKNYTSAEINSLLAAINEKFRLSPTWLIGGTSNGGVAAFNFVAAFPDRFEGIIVAPGYLPNNVQVTEKWSHLKVVLAYGKLDADFWIKSTKTTAKRLKKTVKSLIIAPLEEQGHVLEIKFNADKMYDPYFIP